MVLEKTLESPLDCKEVKPVNPKGNKPWIFIGRTDAEAETPILWSSDVKNWLIGKDGYAGKDWRQEEKGMIEDEMVRKHHWLNGHEFESCPNFESLKLQEMVKNREAWFTAIHGVAKSQTWHKESDVYCPIVHIFICKFWSNRKSPTYFLNIYNICTDVHRHLYPSVRDSESEEESCRFSTKMLTAVPNGWW